MPRLRDRPEGSSGKSTHEYQYERKLIELGICRVVANGDAEGTARALSAAIYGKNLRLLSDWSYLFSRIIGVNVELGHDDILAGEHVSFREAWQIAYDTSAKVRARVTYLERISGAFSGSQGHSTISTGPLQSDNTRGYDHPSGSSGRT